jgi:hypothetical protein
MKNDAARRFRDQRHSGQPTAGLARLPPYAPPAALRSAPAG